MTHPFNQSLNKYINQSIKQFINPVILKCTNSVNQLATISESVFSLNCRGLQVLIALCTVLGGEKTNGTVRWGRGCGEGVNRAWGLGLV